MAKVLSCPECGHKHRLDLLAGLDFFMCQNCNKKLAVPEQAHELAVKKEVEKPVLAVVASSTLSPSAPNSNLSPEVSDEIDEEVVATPINEKSTPSVSPQPIAKPEHKHMHVPHGHIAHLGFSLYTKLIIWALSIGLGFICVVVIPRIFGLGFHAIDFVDVITQTGIGKYKVVVYLVLLWSITTACFVGALNYLFNKLRRSR